MAGDPSNPFNDQLQQLNGVTFGANTLAQSNGVTFGSNNYLTVNSGSVVSNNGSYTGYFGYSPGILTVVDYTYVAGQYIDVGGGPRYRPPVFGKIILSNQLYLGSHVEYIIHGFTGNSLILYLNTNNQAYDRFPLNFGIKILSLDALDTGGGSFPITFGYDPSVYAVPVCFAEGTRIATAAGMRAVEELAIGDLVLNARGEQRPIRWIGEMTARPQRHPHPHQANPVRIAAHAFGPDQPARDLRLSPGHAVHVDGVLVPVGHLVNGATIVQESVESIRYFHVELESHDLLLAEGLACESYLDDGNRASFVNAGEAVALHGRLDPKSWEHACAPLVAAGPQLVEIQQRLHARAEELGWVRSEEPALAILADGAELAPVHRAGNRYWFAVPAVDTLVLRSRSGVLAELVPGLTDPRRLGVAVSQLRLDGEALPLDAAALGAGFYPVEQHGGQHWRWTDGAATLTRDRAGPAMLEVDLLMVAPAWLRPAADLRCVA